MTQNTTPDVLPSRLNDRAIGIGIGFAAFVIYLITLCPTIFTDDCGEITTAVATGGVMHPPGYPLYSLIGWLLIRLIPFGEPAWRLGLLSAVPAAMAVGTTYFGARRTGAGRMWSAVGAIALAFSLTLWQQATKVETYALNAFFVSFLLLLAAGYRQSGLRRDFLLTAFVGGLALTNHLTILWLIPAVLCITIPTLLRCEKVSGGAFVLIVAAACCALPLMLYGYEVIAARSHHGGQVWGDPSTWQRLYLQVSGARYHSYFHAPTLKILIERDGVFAPSWLWRNLYIMLPLAVLGVVRLLRNPATRTLGAGLVLAVGGYLVCNTLYGILNIFEYYTGVVVALSLLAARGGQEMADWLSERLGETEAARIGVLLSGTVALFACATPFITNWRSCDRHGASYLRNLAQNTLRSLPQNSVLMVRGDNRLFPLWYVQGVLGERPDVVIVPHGLLDNWSSPLARDLTGWTAAKIDTAHPEMHVGAILADYAAGKGDRSSFGPANRVLRQAVVAGRPVFYCDVFPGDLIPTAIGGSQLAILPGYTLVPTSLTQQVVRVADRPKPATALARALATEKVIHYEYAPPEQFSEEPDGPITNHVYSYSLTTTAQLFASVGDWPDSLKRADAAYQIDNTQARTCDTYAMASIRSGKVDDAVDAWKRAVALEPRNPDYRQNLDTALHQTAQATGTGE